MQILDKLIEFIYSFISMRIYGIIRGLGQKNWKVSLRSIREINKAQEDYCGRIQGSSLFFCKIQARL